MFKLGSSHIMGMSLALNKLLNDLCISPSLNVSQNQDNHSGQFYSDRVKLLDLFLAQIKQENGSDEFLKLTALTGKVYQYMKYFRSIIQRG